MNRIWGSGGTKISVGMRLVGASRLSLAHPFPNNHEARRIERKRLKYKRGHPPKEKTDYATCNFWCLDVNNHWYVYREIRRRTEGYSTVWSTEKRSPLPNGHVTPPPREKTGAGHHHQAGAVRAKVQLEWREHHRTFRVIQMHNWPPWGTMATHSMRTASSTTRRVPTTFRTHKVRISKI